MGKKIFTALLCIYASMSFIGICIVPSTAQEDPRAAARRKAFTEKAQKMLMNKEWAIYIVTKPATKMSAEVVETDALTFTERTVLSKNRSSEGYAKKGSNYSLSVADDGLSAVWETMQLHENEKDIVFLRGDLDLKSGSMRGSVVYKPSQGQSASYYYSTVRALETAQESQTAAGVEQPQETGKSKKKKK